MLYPPIDLDALIAQASHLEPLPASAASLAELLSVEGWELEEVVEVVALDQGLTGKLLGLANSALHGALDRISTVDAAVLRVGAGSVLAIAVGTGVRRQLSGALPAYGLGEGELWERSVAAAVAAELLPTHAARAMPAGLTTAALLHDIGKLLLARHLDPDLQRYLGLARERGGLAEECAEVEILGVNHAELGGLVAQHWNLPPSIVEGISYHHAPQDSFFGESDPLMAHGTLLCARVSEWLLEGGEGLPASDALLAAARNRLGLTQQGFAELCSEVRLRFDEVRGIFG